MIAAAAARTALLCAVLLWPAGAVAATISVCIDGCDFETLAAAIAAVSDGDIIELHGTEPHTAFGLVIDRSITIRGTSTDYSRVFAAAHSSQATDRIASVTAGHSVTLERFMMSHGRAPGSTSGGALHVAAGATVRLIDMTVVENLSFDGRGGGIYNAGTLELTRSVVSENTAIEAGGGIYNEGVAVLVESTVYRNQQLVLPVEGGGGVFNSSAGVLVAHRTAFIDNSARANGGNLWNAGQATLRASLLAGGDASNGGGIHHLSGELILDATVVGRTFAVNAADNGGGLFIGSGNALIRNSEIHLGAARANGGGLYVAGGSVRVETSTIHTNLAIDGAGVWVCGGPVVDLVNSTIRGNEATGHGGGVYACAGSPVRVVNGTVSHNVADADAVDGGDGGGVFVATSGQVALKNTILDENADLTPGTFADRGPDCFGVLQSAGHNVVGSLGFSLAGTGGTACQLSGDLTGNQVPGDAGLLGFGNWGGPTPTQALSVDSPARDAGNPAGCVDFDLIALVRDQRGHLRDQTCDIGAFEFAGVPPNSLFSSGFEPGE